MAKAAVQMEHEVRAQARWVRCSARKARLVLDTIRGRSVPEARTVLAFSTRAIAHEIEKVLRSAVANAEANHGLSGDTLVVSACYADEGARLKRWRPRARGRAGRIVKQSCHITIRLKESERPQDGTPATARATTAVPPAEKKPARRRSTKAAAEAEAAPRTRTNTADEQPEEAASETKKPAARSKKKTVVAKDSAKTKSASAGKRAASRAKEESE